jgi:hypothetical protein
MRIAIYVAAIAVLLGINYWCRPPCDARDADPCAPSFSSRFREGRRLGLGGDRPRKERLAGAGRPAKKDSARDPAAEPAVLVRVAEEVDDLGQLLFLLVDVGLGVR